MPEFTEPESWVIGSGRSPFPPAESVVLYQALLIRLPGNTSTPPPSRTKFSSALSCASLSCETFASTTTRDSASIFASSSRASTVLVVTRSASSTFAFPKGRSAISMKSVSPIRGSGFMSPLTSRTGSRSQTGTDFIRTLSASSASPSAMTSMTCEPDVSKLCVKRTCPFSRGPSEAWETERSLPSTLKITRRSRYSASPWFWRLARTRSCWPTPRNSWLRSIRSTEMFSVTSVPTLKKVSLGGVLPSASCPARRARSGAGRPCGSAQVTFWKSVMTMISRLR